MKNDSGSIDVIYVLYLLTRKKIQAESYLF